MAEYVFGVDVGGTTIKMGLFDMSGEVLEKWEIPTRTEDNGVNILPDIGECVLKKMEQKGIAKEQVSGIGIGVPGPVDGKGVVHKCANLGWGEFNVNEKLSEITGLMVKAGNDANVAALGEMWKGGGRGYSSLVMVTLGTGVGGGVIIDGQIMTGSVGAGGEIGHIHVQDGEAERCGCGNHGCLEQYASATGVVRLANRELEDNTDETVLVKDQCSAKDVWDAVKAGDKVAVRVAEKFGKYLGEGLACIASVLDPEAFVIGGGVSRAGDVLIGYIEKYYMPVVFHSGRNVKFVMATLGNDAGIYGAAKLVV
ncbi:MAG: ROK family glucokinase [Lachnospiraceae bacterium]|nr:ROK family glucokinase [Lachnospiraceae bacterium]MBR5377365.1 ROK family glucokinase [Lachnospiraceae bacterium]